MTVERWMTKLERWMMRSVITLSMLAVFDVVAFCIIQLLEGRRAQ